MTKLDKTIEKCYCGKEFILDTDSLYILSNIWRRLPISKEWFDDFRNWCPDCMEKNYGNRELTPDAKKLLGLPKESKVKAKFKDISPFRRIKELIDKHPEYKKVLKEEGIKSMSQLKKICENVKKIKF